MTTATTDDRRDTDPAGLPSALHTGLFIAGNWRDGAERRRIDVHNPADETVITTVAGAETRDCLDAVEAAAAAADGWARTAPRERADILHRAWMIMREERAELAAIITAENGKAIGDALGEVDYAAEFFRWYAEEAVRIRGDFRLAPNGDKRIIVTREPVGVCVLITPWNFPAAMATRKLAPALAAGCTAVLKPATETPLTAAAVVDVLARAGTPAGVVNSVTPHRTGESVRGMIHHPAVRKVSFTGSTEVGTVLLHEAADSVVSTSMELGGNAPFVVLPGADIDRAVEGAMVAKMRNGGSACTAANRFYVHRDIREDFTTRLTAAMADVTMGPGRDPEASLGALVSRAERDKVAALVDAAVAEGARVTTGGEVPPGAGAFYPPTVLADVRPDGSITRAEVFGPVAPIVVFDTEDEAVALSNATDMGLVGYVFGDVAEAMRMAHRLDVGMVAVNRGVLSDPAAPFGGVKQSGLGREGGFEGLEEYLEEKYIAVDL